ncbi:MAG: ATP-dependent helicase HrpB [Firmicutes bacterium]|nr:ATP-dependent helicase HrpB [Bacillota bacterium]
MNTLPIDEILPELKAALVSRVNAVLAAPPGSGKTTRIPLALLNEAWLGKQRIIMLEPRRLAARAAARYMAHLLGEKVGETVGYRVRLDTCISPKTRIEVITEGVLTRMLQNDQGLDGVGLIIFDEFHERSIHADLGLALAIDSQTVLREDLRLLVMSATLAAEPVAALLPDAALICGSGRSFPVDTKYLEKRLAESLEAKVAQTVLLAFKHDDGDILVFLPGVAEIRRVQSALIEQGLGQLAQITPLYGALPITAQDQAILPSESGKRKVVLATSIAETSLTVEGIRIVVDSGVMRVPRYSARTGLTSLETIRVSRSAADQRQGRAGRLAPGVCYRLWTKQEDACLEPYTIPEILSADLTTLALELAAWGIQKHTEMHWLDFPPEQAVVQAQQLLHKLEAVDDKNCITHQGRQMLQLGLHPRLAHMVLKAGELGFGRVACELAAILSERDFVKATDIDLRLRVEYLRRFNWHKNIAEDAQTNGLDIVLGRRIYQEAERLQQEFSYKAGRNDDLDYCGLVLAFAYPDRIGQQRGGGRFLLESGRGAMIGAGQTLTQADYIVAADLDGQGSDSRIFLAAPIMEEQIKSCFSQQIAKETQVIWDVAAQAVRARVYEQLGSIILKDTPCTNPDPGAIWSALLQRIVREGLAMLPWTRTAKQLRERLMFVRQWEKDWPDVSDEALISTLNNWLGPYVYGITSRAELAKLNLAAVLESLLTWEQRQTLESYAPTHLIVPSGQRIPINYSNPDSPILAVKLQEMFGLQETPTIAQGKVRLTLQLLSPAQRPVQVTQDLANFWSNTYFEVKKDLMGRYPKHYWPDDPLAAIPTNRVRPQLPINPMTTRSNTPTLCRWE